MTRLRCRGYVPVHSGSAAFEVWDVDRPKMNNPLLQLNPTGPINCVPTARKRHVWAQVADPRIGISPGYREPLLLGVDESWRVISN